MADEPGIWDPGQHTTSVAPDPSILKTFVDTVSASADNLASALPGEMVREQAGLMKLDASSWEVVSTWSDADIEALIRFFTLAEMQLPGWDAGQNSPVVLLVRILRDRKTFSADLRKWIKANTDNRYLPYGSAL